MENSRKKAQSRVGEKANELLEEGKNLAGEYYDEGVEKARHAQESIKEYSDDIVVKIRQKPFTSMLIAGGVGFLLSAILRR